MDGLILVTFGWMFLYPLIGLLVVTTDLLVYANNPLWRIGIIVLITFLSIYYLLRKKYTKRQNDFLENFSLRSGKAQNIEYFYTYLFSEKHKTSAITTYIEGIYGYDFVLKLEGRFERFFKTIGLNNECQSGEIRFDDTVYIASDNPFICEQLQTNEALRKVIYDIFSCYQDQNIKVYYVQCFDGRIIVSAGSKSETATEAVAASFAYDVAVLLKKTIDLLPSKGSINDRMYREQSSRFAYVALLISFALIVNGSIGLIIDKTSVGILPRLVDYSSIVPVAAKTAILITFLFSIVFFYILRHSSRLVSTLLAVWTVGLLGLYLSSLVEIKDINIYLDSSKTQISNYKIVHKEKNWYPKKTVYFLHLADQNNPNDVISERVSYDLFSEASEGDNALIYSRKGFLNYQWIEKIQIEKQ